MPSIQRLFDLRRLPHTALAMAACGLGGIASAQTGNPTAGQALYVQRINFPVSGLLNCADCHGPQEIFGAYLAQRGASTDAGVLSQLNGAISADRGGMSLYSSWTTQQRTDVSAYIARGASAPAPPPSGSATPTASPNPVLFPSTSVGSTGAVIGILLTNSAGTTVTFATRAVVIAAGDANDFQIVAPPAGTTACQTAGGTLGPGMSCSIGARFAPTASGNRGATWRVDFANGVYSRALSLQGTATTTPAPAPAPSPAPAPAPAPSPPASSPDAGGGAIGGLQSLAGLLALWGVSGLRRRRTDRSLLPIHRSAVPGCCQR